MNDIRISTNQDEFDFDFIYQFISNSYWAKGISKSVMANAIANSYCFAAFNGKQQVAFARLITDKATFAYLADVFVDEKYRGLGISKLMMSAIVNDPDIVGLRRILLTTFDAHGLYRQFGFESIEQPDRLMQIWKPDVYQVE